MYSISKNIFLEPWLCSVLEIRLIVLSGGKANRTGGNKGSGGRQGEAFKRVKDEHWVGSLKEGFDNNTYEVIVTVTEAV